ncbi:glycosyltransferase family 4 protein [Pseudofulvibacter geojedonensis]|uniref:Glycosyltransferase family 4 protein n=1 Tax=Pseudofulvibacter geojedonensis TaxID=1123758 RepID=A0ABW3HYN8_9FLAO
MKKRIAIVCNYTLQPDRLGGMDRFYKMYDEVLKKKEYEVEWFFTKAEKYNFYKDLTIYHANGASVEMYFLDHIKNNKVKYDTVVSHFTELCTPFYKKLKQVINPYIICVDHNPRPLNGFPLKKRLKKRLSGFLYSKYIDAFIGVSQYTVNHIINDFGAHLKSKTKVVYNGIDTNVFNKRITENKNTFIVASHLRESKGIQDLLKALSLLPNKILKEVEIDIYGEGPYEDDLKKMSNDFSLNNTVFFKGSSPNLNELFCKYRYMLQPTYMECFSLSILESLSANIPVITTTVGGNLEVIKDGVNGYIHNPGDVNKLSVIIKDIVEEKKAINIDTSDIIKEQFYLEKMVDDHVNLLPCM